MAKVVDDTAANWAGMTAANIALIVPEPVEGDFLRETDTGLIKVWTDVLVDYDDLAYTYEPFKNNAAPTVHYRGAVAPSGEAEVNYWALKTASEILALGINPYDILYELDTGLWKVFDGRTDYDDLPYVSQTNAAVDYLLNAYGQVNIINMALGRLGADPIASVEDKKPGAKLGQQFYRMAVADVMSAHDWTSAITRKTLEQIDPESDEYNEYSGFEFQYRVPQAPRPVRVLHLFQAQYGYQRVDTPFKLEGNYLFTNMDYAGLVYIGDYSANTAQLDPFVIQLIVLKLASYMAFSITGSANMVNALSGEYSVKMAEAQFADASRSRESTNIDVFQSPAERW